MMLYPVHDEAETDVEGTVCEAKRGREPSDKAETDVEGTVCEAKRGREPSDEAETDVEGTVCEAKRGREPSTTSNRHTPPPCGITVHKNRRRH